LPVAAVLRLSGALIFDGMDIANPLAAEQMTSGNLKVILSANLGNKE